MEITGLTSPVRPTPEKSALQTHTQPIQPQEVRKVLDSGDQAEKIQQEAIAKAASEAATREDLMALAAEMNDVVAPLHTRISFAYSESASAMYLNVLDSSSGKVIRQFPSEEALDFAAKMREFVGMLLDQRI